jgi:XTP/dITP diphosphohydrolase
VRRLLLATTNVGKQREFARLLAGFPADLVTPADVALDLDVEEPHDSYAENAAAKARAYADASGLLALADDSGIEIAALEWGPGVRSARWGGGRGADRVLEALAGIEDRRARMRCVVALGIPRPDGASVETFAGTIEGTIASTRRGAGGFGYDPIFLTPDGSTTAELADEEKDRISHRGRAVAAAGDRLRELLADD